MNRRGKTTNPAEAAVRRPGTVQSVEVAVRILEVLSQRSEPVRVTELAREFGMTKARVSRHLLTLTGLGLLDRAREGEGYIFGWKLLQLGRAAVFNSSIAEVARRHLIRLQESVRHTAIFSTPIANGAVVNFSIISRTEPGVSIGAGTILSLPASPSARIAALYTGQGGRGVQAKARANMERYGVDFEIEARGNGLGGISAPVFEADGALAGVVSLILFSSLLKPEPPASLIAAVRKCAAAVQQDYAPNPAMRQA